MRIGLAIAAVLSVLASSALALAPAPRKPIAFDRMMGRWYEVARTANDRQAGCHGAYSDWVRTGAGRATVTNHCHKGSPGGPDSVFRSTARLVDAARAQISMGFFLGAVNQEYWVLDHADDYSWSIMATPGGNYVWVFSRQKSLPAAQRDALVARVKAFGYPVSRLEVGA
ncbi:MAG: lipocalin family protein [Caulobacteraceae bacterium]|nr:lipocalin family protein [Caulobacteraceae bacterium]